MLINKKILFLGTFTLILSNSYFITAQSYLRLQKIKIISDSPLNQNIGFDNSSIINNGELNIIQNMIQPGDIIFDVGANKGDWSNLVFKYHNDIQLYAFEPIAAVYENLKRNLQNYNALCFNIAVSDKSEIKSFYYYTNPSHSELSGLYSRPILQKILPNSHPITIKVITKPLNSFCSEQKISRINFLKIDTEGAELDVLNGALSLIKQQAIDVIQFEYGGTYTDSKVTLKMAYDLLSQNNYSIFRIIPEGLVEISAWNEKLENYRYSNYLAIARGK